MSGLTTADLARLEGLNLRGSGLDKPYKADPEFVEMLRANSLTSGLTVGIVLDLIKAARLQVALDELPLPEGWRFSGITPGGPIGNWLAGARGRTAITREGLFPEMAHGYGPTMLDAVLALGDALRSRT